MIRDYQIVSPSLDGILRHDSIVYDGLMRPLEITRILDRSETYRAIDYGDINIEDRKRIEDYFHDLYGIIVKRISEFVMKSEPSPDEAVKLQAMLQELIKVKKLL